MDKSSGKKLRTRPTIAVMIDYLNDDYQKNVWKGINHTAEINGCNIIGIIGSSIKDTIGGYKQRNRVYDLISSRIVDGIICLTGSVGGYITEKETSQFFEKYHPTPVVHILKSIPDSVSVILDNENAIVRMVDHLVKIHDIKKIAFLAGPQNDDNAIERFSGYKKGLEMHGIPFDPGLVFYCERFERFIGNRAVRYLLEEKRGQFNALIASNDYLAIDAITELQAQGLKVPEDVAVTGFDDIHDAISVYPPLTTIGMPYHEISRKAFELVMGMIDGKDVPRLVSLSGTLMIRNSCGCANMFEHSSDPLIAGIQYNNGKGNTRPGYAIIEKLPALLEALFPIIKADTNYSDWALELCGALFKEVSGGEEGVFLDQFRKLIMKTYQKGIHFSYFYMIANSLFSFIRENLPKLSRKTGGLKERTLISIGVFAEQILTSIAINSELQHVVVDRVSQGINYAYDENQIKITLREQLPTLGIKSCFLSVYKNDKTSGLKLSRMLFHYQQSGNVRIDTKKKVFPSRNLVPGNFRTEKRFTYFLLPLYFKSEDVGFILLEAGNTDESIYENLTKQLGISLKGASLIKEVRRYNKKLEMMVNERTKALKEAQKELVDNAHKAGMAEVAAGMIHNIGNLLNSVCISSDTITNHLNKSHVGGFLEAIHILKENQDRMKEFFTGDTRAEVIFKYFISLSEFFQQEENTVEKEAHALQEKIDMIKEIVQDLHVYAVDDYRLAMIEEISMSDAVETSLKLKSDMIDMLDIRVIKNIPANLRLKTQKSKLIQILVNIIKNALEAMQDMENTGRILTFNADNTEREFIKLSISDSGIGIEDKDIKKLFTFGYTTKKSGHGFGLHTCANFMKDMGGKINITSGGRGKGAVFTLVFPVSNEKNGEESGKENHK